MAGNKQIKTVGDLKEALKNFDDKLPVFITIYHESITEAGTDLGGEEDHGIENVTDLETRIVLHPGSYGRIIH